MQKASAMLGLVLAALLAIIAQPHCAWACDCDIPSFIGARDQAVAIFAGRVESITNNPRSSIVAVTFAPSTVWKGTLPPTVVILTSAGSPSCGYEFQDGQEYLVYARPAGTALMFAPPAMPALEVSLCSRTQPLAEAAEDLAALGDGQAASINTAETPQPSVLPNTSGEIEAPPAPNLRALVVLGGLGVMVIVFAGHVLRRSIR